MTDLQAKLYHSSYQAEKIQRKKTVCTKRETPSRTPKTLPKGAAAARLLDREGQSPANVRAT